MSEDQNILLTESNAQLTAEAVAEPDTEQIKQTETPVPVAVSEQEEINEHILLAEQFDNYLRIAKSLMRTLKRPKDVEICSNLMHKVERLNGSKHLEVKRNNNRFFRYCLTVLNWTSIHQPMELYQCWYNRNQDEATEPISEFRIWLEDEKSYVASKSLKDGTNILYAAISYDPQAGWQNGGLNILAKRGACQSH